MTFWPPLIFFRFFGGSLLLPPEPERFLKSHKGRIKNYSRILVRKSSFPIGNFPEISKMKRVVQKLKPFFIFKQKSAVIKLPIPLSAHIQKIQLLAPITVKLTLFLKFPENFR